MSPFFCALFYFLPVFIQLFFLRVIQRGIIYASEPKGVQ